jgi:iron complex outermembrane receptor protein
VTVIHRNIIQLCLLCSLLCASFTANSVESSLSSNHELIEFALPTQNLGTSLIMLSKQAGIPIIFSSSIIKQKTAPALHQNIKLDEALNFLLKNSGLFYRLVDDRFITVSNTPLPPEDPELGSDSHYSAGLEHVRIYGQMVTGSRIKRSDYVSSTPVDIIEGQELELRGSATIVEKLKFLPAVSGSPTSTAVTNGGNGTATVTLRGLPASNTLVLVNGRRTAPDGLGGDAIDLNTISPTTIERVEVLKDGASSIYGADAIAGVVNIILKSDFDGLQLDTSYGETSRGDMATKNTSIQWGKIFERGYTSIAATIYKQGGIDSRDRDITINSDGRRWGGSDNRSSATPAARITLPDDRTVTLIQDDNDYRDGTSIDDFRAATDEDLYNFSEITTALLPHEHKSIQTNVQFDFDNNVGFFLESSYDTNFTESTLAPTPIFTAFENTPIIVSADNAYNLFDVDLVDVRRRMIELSPRKQRNSATARRVATGVAGFTNRWNWELSYTWSKHDAQEKLLHLIDARNLKTALGPDENCTGSCVALNVFGPPGSVDQQQRDFIEIDSKIKGYSKLSSWSAYASGPLLKFSGGTIEAAMGMEYRQESTSKRPDQSIASGATIGGANFGVAGGERNVAEAYIETNLPLINRQFGIDSLTLELSSRYSRYSDFGSTTNPKIGLMLRVTNDLLFRATYTKGFRAPSLNELYKVSSESQDFLVDPCANPSNTSVLPGCPQQTDPTRVQYLTVIGGNRNLEPEKSLNNTFGLVWTPSIIEGLTTTIDYFRIKQDNVIDANAQNLININTSTGLLSDIVIRDSNYEIQQIIAQNINTGKRDISGFDLSARYHYNSGDLGRFTFALNGSHFINYTVQGHKDAKMTDIAGTFVDDASDGLGAIPDWKTNIGVLWNQGSWQGGYTIHFVSSLRETVPSTDRLRRVNSWITHDAQLGYNFKVGKGLKVLVGIDNLFNRDPPKIASAFNNNIDARTHELKGRYLYLKLSQKI